MSGDITDQQIADAIAASLPFEYLDDLKARVAEKLGQPDMAKDRDFSYRVYCLNRQREESAIRDRVAELGFVFATTEVLEALSGKKAEMLHGVGSVFSGEVIRQGQIIPTGKGGYMFLPKGKRTKGYLPSYIRAGWSEEKTQQSCAESSGPGSQTGA